MIPFNLKDRLGHIKKMATEFEWSLIEYQDNIKMVSFYKLDRNWGDIRMNIYITKMTVSTALTHPKKGKTQLFRKHVDEDLLKWLFTNPRQHTKKGYYKKT